jgi:pimeloyl-ACP methyl ester carboxylesterase
MKGAMSPPAAVAVTPLRSWTREDAWIPSGDGRLAAWVYRPAGSEPHPCVVLAHGLDGVREQRLDAYAARFAAAGMAGVVFDYRHFGASDGEPRQLVDVGRQLEDWRAAVSFARGLELVDPDRVALWGTSFSGGHVVTLAAEDERIAAASVQVSFADGLEQLAFYPLGLTLRLLWAGAIDQVRAWCGATPHEVTAAGPAGSTSVMTTPGALRDLERMTPRHSTWRNGLCARFSLYIGFYRPGRRAREVECPLLVCVADGDRLAPPAPAVAMARAAPRGRLCRYPCDHFGIYLEHFDAVVAEQLAFLREHLRVPTRP